MKRLSGVLSIFLVGIFFLCLFSGVSYANPKMSNCSITPKEIGTGTEVKISFDYTGVEGGLKEGKILLIQKIQIPGEEKAVTRTSNWQARLHGLSAYTSESGRFERKFVNTDIWYGPKIDLIYEFKVIDGKGRESNICTTTITPK